VWKIMLMLVNNGSLNSEKAIQYPVTIAMQ